MLTNEQIKEVKARGFLHNRGTNCFSARVITKNGVLTSEQLEIISKAAKKFGNSTVSFTVRLTLEVPFIDYNNIDAFCDYIKPFDLFVGGTGAKVRPIVACKGTTCVFGLCDTQGLAKQIHDEFFVGYSNVDLPHKFKIAVGGCPNNCAKPDLNDLGIVGQRKVNFNKDLCKGCKKCQVEENCPMKAAKVVDKKITIDNAICNNCGRCVTKCPFKINESYTDMYKIYVGGRWGKKIRLGSMLNQLYSHDQIFSVIKKVISIYKENGVKGERFGETIDRIGLEKFEKLLEETL